MSEKCIVNPERDCLGLMKALEIEEEIDELRRGNSDTHKRIFERIGALEVQGGMLLTQYQSIMKELGGLTEKMSGLVELEKHSIKIDGRLENIEMAMDSVKETVNGVSTRIGEIESKPGKRWDGLVDKLWSGIIGVIAGAIGTGIIILIKLGGGA